MKLHCYLLRMTEEQFQAIRDLAKKEHRSIREQIIYILWTAGVIKDEKHKDTEKTC